MSRERGPTPSSRRPRGASPIAVVAAQEFRAIVRSGAFLIAALAGVALIALMSFAPAILAFFDRKGVRDVAVIDPAGAAYEALEAAVAAAGAEALGFRVRREPAPATPERVRELLRDGDVDAVLEVRPGEGPAGEPAFVLTTPTADDALLPVVKEVLTPVVGAWRSAQMGLSPDQWMALTAEPAVRAEVLAGGPREDGNPVVRFFTGYGLLFLLYVQVAAYGAVLMNGIVMEKANRVIEVLLAAVSPSTLIFGKLAGVGLAGMVQVLVWAVAGTAIAAWPGAGPGGGGAGGGTAGILAVPLEAWITLLAAFPLAFLIYGALYAVVGAMSGRTEDAGQLQMPVTLLLMVAFFAGVSGLGSPDGAVVRWAAWIPPVAPMALLVRLVQGRAAWWEVAGATAWTAAVAVLLLLLAGRVYARTALRMQRTGWLELLGVAGRRAASSRGEGA
ncbi:MAG TPA: ABC transporter permease [Thermaerobacter sp.]